MTAYKEKNQDMKDEGEMLEEILREEGGNQGDLPVTAAVFCRSGRQDDGAGHQNLQQDHQDEVEVDLKAEGRDTSRDDFSCGEVQKI